MDNPQTTLRIPPEYLQVLAHYYRAEVYRSSVWRTRLDVTTNWAILAMTAAFSWSFTSTNAEAHVVFPLTSLIILLLLSIETRRYRYFDVFWTRARLLEGHLIIAVLNPELKLLQGNWREFLSNDLLLPSFKISFWEAMARRLASNYIFIFLLLFLGWVLRVYAAADVEPVDGWVTFVEFSKAARYRFIHWGYCVGFEIATIGLVLFILFVNWRGRQVSGEIRRRDPSAPSWPI
jgi:uncharacterized membrane protein